MEKILVLDFGGQYAHLIARRFRNLGFYAEIALPDTPVDEISDVRGIVMSGGPASVYDPGAPAFNRDILALPVPILGLCYGHHLLLQEYGALIKKAGTGEFGFAELHKVKDSPLFEGVSFPAQVWMSHSDAAFGLPPGFEAIASTHDCEIAAAQNTALKRFTLQFHAEVKDTPCGNRIFYNFACYCALQKNWDKAQVLKAIHQRITVEAGNKKVLLFLSGGVDSSVAFGLLTQAIGKERVLGLYINNGFMRKEESQKIMERYQRAGFENVIMEDASDTFLKAVAGIYDPQEKRRIVGETFLTVRDQVVARLSLVADEWLLGQGTLYPDIIESGGTRHADVIKTHHNRVEGIRQLLEKGMIIEPLKELYKDEVREIGREIGLAPELICRHPFPGPGLSINVLCSPGMLSIEDDIRFREMTAALPGVVSDEYRLTALPVKSVGVQGDYRTYSFPLCLETPGLAVSRVDWEALERLSSYLTNTVRQANRVVWQLFRRQECRLVQAFCTRERLDMIRAIDALVLDELKQSGWYDRIFQHLTINLPFASHAGACAVVLRPLCSEDVMTARFARLDPQVLVRIVEAIEKYPFVDALFYDITNKPPATFGWE